MASRAEARGGVDGIATEDVLYDDRREQHYVAVAVTEEGVTLRRRGTEYYVPHTIFAQWYDSDRITQNDDIPVEAPDWITPQDEAAP